MSVQWETTLGLDFACWQQDIIWYNLILLNSEKNIVAVIYLYGIFFSCFYAFVMLIV